MLHTFSAPRGREEPACRTASTRTSPARGLARAALARSSYLTSVKGSPQPPAAFTFLVFRKLISHNLFIISSNVDILRDSNIVSASLRVSRHLSPRWRQPSARSDSKKIKKEPSSPRADRLEWKSGASPVIGSRGAAASRQWLPGYLQERTARKERDGMTSEEIQHFCKECRIAAAKCLKGELVSLRQVPARQ